MLQLRSAKEQDAKLLLDWRNDPVTRANSKNTDVIPLETHCRWLAGALMREDMRLMIAEAEGVPVGTVRLDFTPEACLLSWTVAPEHRNCGIGTKIVQLAISGADAPSLRAEIKLTNEASRRIATRLGFTEQQADENGLSTWTLSRHGTNA